MNTKAWATYYISPNGSDSNTGLTSSDPLKTFAAVMAAIDAGPPCEPVCPETVILMSTATVTRYTGSTTGYLSYNDGSCSNCDQMRSGGPESGFATVKAMIATNTVIVDGGTREGLFVGRSTRKDQYIKFIGITFYGGGALYNTDHVYISSCGFVNTQENDSGVFGIGTNDGNWGNTNNLVENSWFWGKDRIIVSNYRAAKNIWRRNFIRGDGCASVDCSGSGNPNVAFTVYNSSDVSVQNMIIFDRILNGGEPYSDFATAQHDAGPNDTGVAEYNLRNEWLGTLSLNSEDLGYNFECDGCTSPSVKMVNVLSIDAGGLNIGTNNVGVIVNNATVLNGGQDGIRLAPGVTGGNVTNVVVSTISRYGVNSAVQPSYSDVFNAATSNYNQTTCATGCKTTNPRADGTPASIVHVPRIESGSALSGTGSGGADYGANLLYQYGVSGKFYNESSSNTLGGTSLWPIDMQDRMKYEMCTLAGISRDWCGTSKTLTQYIWDYLGDNTCEFCSNAEGESETVYNRKARISGNLRLRGSMVIK